MQPLYSLSVPADLKFATVAGCASGVLKWEFESYDASSGGVNIWVQIPILSHTADTVIYMCYGDMSITTWQGGASGSAWDANYVGVWHLPNGMVLATNDSTSNAYNGTNNNSTPAGSGKIGGGASFTQASSQSISVIEPSGAGDKFSSSNMAADVAISAWVNTSGFHSLGSSRNVIVFRANYANSSGYGLTIASDNKPYFQYGAGNTEAAGVSAIHGGWHYIVGVRTGTTLRIYTDGTAGTNGSGASNLGTGTGSAFVMGADASSGIRYLNGSVDEVRVSTSARSADWILAEYNNQNSPSTFYTITP